MKFKNTKLYLWYNSHKKLTVILSCSIALLLICLITAISFFVYYRITTLPNNAYFKGLYLGNMKQSQIKTELDQKLNPTFKTAKLNVIAGEKSQEISLEPYNFKFEADNVFKACKRCNFSKGELPSPTISYDKNALVSEINNLSPTFTVQPTAYSYQIEQNTIALNPGNQGSKINPQNLLDGIVNASQQMNFGDLNLPCENFLDDSVAINIDDLHNKVFVKRKDASYSIDSNGTLSFDQEANGVDFDVDQAKKIVTDPLNGQYQIPLILDPAQTTVKQLKYEHDHALCPSLISSYTTNFSTGEKASDRNFNISKAASSINGVILYPNEAFSALKSIGPANASQGYKDAAVYTPDGPSTGAGGGVCQVSSTAYLAAIYGYMDIVERHPHSYTVGYVPLGYDAAFSSPSTDLRFKNTRNNPIKITASTTSSSITVSIFGTPSDLDNCKVNLNSSVEQTIPPTIKEQPSPDLPIGQTKVQVQGQNGYVVNTQKTVIKNGSVIEQNNIKSSYKPITKLVLVGTKNVTPSPDSDESLQMSGLCLNQTPFIAANILVPYLTKFIN